MTTSKVVKGGTSGNGKRDAEQAELDLDAETALPATSVGASTQKPPEASPGTPAPAAAPPAMRELGLTAKDAWKVDLRGKRVALDEKEWREELARALGRAPAKA